MNSLKLSSMDATPPHKRFSQWWACSYHPFTPFMRHTRPTPHGRLALGTYTKRGKNLLPGRQKPEALPPGNIGMRGSLVVRLRPCIISSTPSPPLLPPRLDTTQYTRADISSAQRAHSAFPHCCCSPAGNEIWPANFPRSSRRGSFRRGNKRVERTKTPHREQQKYSGGKNRLPSQPREFQPPPRKTKTKKRSTHTQQGRQQWSNRRGPSVAKICFTWRFACTACMPHQDVTFRCLIEVIPGTSCHSNPVRVPINRPTKQRRKALGQTGTRPGTIVKRPAFGRTPRKKIGC